MHPTRRFAAAFDSCRPRVRQYGIAWMAAAPIPHVPESPAELQSSSAPAPDRLHVDTDSRHIRGSEHSVAIRDERTQTEPAAEKPLRKRISVREDELQQF